MQGKLFYTIVFILVIGGGLWMLDRWSVLPIWSISLEECLPEEASLVVALPRMGVVQQLLEDGSSSPWGKALAALPGLTKHIETINTFIDTLFPSRQGIDGAPGLLSVNAMDEQKLGFTWIVDLRNLGTLTPGEWMDRKGIVYQSARFRGDLVWTVALPSGSTVVISKVRNLLILAEYPYQVEAVLATEVFTSNWVKDVGQPTGEHPEFSIYWNFKSWDNISDALFSEIGRELVTGWQDWYATVRLDFYAETGTYRIAGELLNHRKWLNTPMKPALNEADIWGLLPKNTASIKAINLADYNQYFRTTSWQKLGRFQRFFLSWMEGPAIELTLRPFSGQIAGRQLYFLGFKNRPRVDAALNDWMEEVGVLQTINYQGFVLNQVNEDQNVFPWSSRSSWQNPWWTIIGDRVVIGFNRAALENWIDQYTVGNNLPLTEVARQLTLSESDGQFSFFVNWKEWKAALKDIIRDRQLAQACSELGQLSWEIESKGISATLKGLWKKEQLVEQNNDLAWRLSLSDEVAAGPWRFKDDQSQAMTAAQDDSHRLYLINREGKVVWEKQLEERIISSVNTVELPTKLALAFNTSRSIYLFDFAGETIGPYPLNLRNPTAHPLSVVDFNQNGDLTFFITSNDGCIYGYDLEAGPVAGWSPKCQLGELPHAVLHFQAQNKDFLVVQSRNGSMRAFARDGSLRLAADFAPAQSTSSPQVQLLAGLEQIVSCTDSGVVQVLTLEEEAFQFRLPIGNNKQVKMFYENFTGDQRKDYLLNESNILSLHAYTQNGLKKQFEQKFSEPIDQVFTVTSVNGKKQKIGVLLEGNQRIYLMSGKGEIETDFPLAGSTPFVMVDLFGAGERHLIVGYQDEILAYRLGN